MQKLVSRLTLIVACFPTHLSCRWNIKSTGFDSPSNFQLKSKIWRSCFARLWALDDMDSWDTWWEVGNIFRKFYALVCLVPPTWPYFTLRQAILPWFFYYPSEEKCQQREMPTKRIYQIVEIFKFTIAWTRTTDGLFTNRLTVCSLLPTRVQWYKSKSKQDSFGNSFLCQNYQPTVH